MAFRPTHCLNPDCGAPLPPNPDPRGRGRPRLYCNPTCRQQGAGRTAIPDVPDPVCAGVDKAPANLELVSRCTVCQETVDVDTLTVPDDPAAWARAQAVVATVMHGHPVTVTWEAVGSRREERASRPRPATRPWEQRRNIGGAA